MFLWVYFPRANPGRLRAGYSAYNVLQFSKRTQLVGLYRSFANEMGSLPMLLLAFASLFLGNMQTHYWTSQEAMETCNLNPI
jgi:hypothetical protein